MIAIYLCTRSNSGVFPVRRHFWSKNKICQAGSNVFTAYGHFRFDKFYISTGSDELPVWRHFQPKNGMRQPGSDVFLVWRHVWLENWFFKPEVTWSRYDISSRRKMSFFALDDSAQRCSLDATTRSKNLWVPLLSYRWKNKETLSKFRLDEKSNRTAAVPLGRNNHSET